MTVRTQLNRGLKRRLMYVENKDGDIDGADARVGWVTFSKSGKSVFYRGRELVRANGVRGNFLDVKTREEFWVSGVKKRGSNVHWAEPASVEIDDDARQSYDELKLKGRAR
jgi:hypothetical protein